MYTPTITFENLFSHAYIIIKLTDIDTDNYIATFSNKVLFPCSNDLYKRKFNQVEHIFILFSSLHIDNNNGIHITALAVARHKGIIKIKGMYNVSTICTKGTTIIWREKRSSYFHGNCTANIFCSKEMHLPFAKSIGFKEFLINLQDLSLLLHLRMCFRVHVPCSITILFLLHK